MDAVGKDLDNALDGVQVNIEYVQEEVDETKKEN